MSKHILSVLVENKAGVLSKVVGLFSRRGFNIDSLAVGTTDDLGRSRITIIANGDEYLLEQLTKQLNKLIDIIKVKNLKDDEVVCRELALIKVLGLDTKSRQEIIQISNIFRSKIIDVAKTSLTIEITGTTDKIDALYDMVEPYGRIEMVRTGMIAIERGAQTIN